MPQLDETGPISKGPLTGRGMGNCKNENCIYYGFGGGRGLRYRQLKTLDSNEQDLQEIKNQLESELRLVNEKINNIGK